MFEEPDQEAALAWGKWLFAQECEFLWGVASLSDLPEFDQPEVAFIGRSNVGKSSLLNALTSRISLARTSHTPGRTQQLNFFSLGRRLVLVDMPGYGYAKASKIAIARWNKLVQFYLKSRLTLVRVYMLIDGRHGIKTNDMEMMQILDTAAVPYRLVATKADKVNHLGQQELQKDMEGKIQNHPAAFPEVYFVSSTTKQGIAELRADIAQFAIKSPLDFERS